MISPLLYPLGSLKKKQEKTKLDHFKLQIILIVKKIKVVPIIKKFIFIIFNKMPKNDP